MQQDEELEHDIPFLNFIGARLLAWCDGEARLLLPLRDEHLNRSGIVHGGLYCVLMDAAGGLAGCYGGGPGQHVRSVTLSLTTSFLERTSTGSMVAHATVRKRGKQIYFSTIEVKTDQNKLVAMGEGTFRLLSSS